MSCTYETFEEYTDIYSSINRIADRNGRYETESQAIAAAKVAGYDLKKVEVVFFLD